MTAVRSLLKELGYMAPRWCAAVNEDLLTELAALDREFEAELQGRPRSKPTGEDSCKPQS